MEHCEFLLKRLLRYCGASSLSDLKTIVFRLIADELFNGLPAQPLNEWPAWGVKAATGNNPCSSV